MTSLRGSTAVLLLLAGLLMAFGLNRRWTVAHFPPASAVRVVGVPRQQRPLITGEARGHFDVPRSAPEVAEVLAEFIDGPLLDANREFDRLIDVTRHHVAGQA